LPVSESAIRRARIGSTFLFGSQNELWCATDGGLYRSLNEKNGELKFELVVPYEGETSMVAFADHRGRLWFGMDKELIEIINDQVIKYGSEDEVGQHKIRSIIEDSHGRLLIANESDIFELTESLRGNNRGTWRKLPLSFKRDQGINAILDDQAGALWIGTWDGLVKYQHGSEIVYTSAQGLSDNAIAALDEDRDGNLWIGTVGGGVCKLSSELIVSFTKTEGLPNQDVRKVFEDRRGQIYASIENGGLVKIVERKAILLSQSQSLPFSDVNERFLQDEHGDWWIGTDTGLYRFQGPELQLRHGHKFTVRDGLANGPIMGGVYQDLTGKIWTSPENQGLYSFDPSQSTRNGFARVVPSSPTSLFKGALTIMSDRGRKLWLGGHEWLATLAGGQLEMLQPTDGLPETRPRAFFVDSRGWLWIGLRYKGVSVTKNSAEATPHFINYSTANGLASDSVWAITEDDSGRMYFGTGKGLDQLDLSTGRIRHFNTDDGLASDIVNYCMKDRAGNIWVGTTLGLSKFNPHAEHITRTAAPVYLSRIQIAGEDVALPETGAQQTAPVELSASRNNLAIEYVALSFQGENELRYQYKLDGVDKDWSSPTEARSINYARLAPGRYQFLVRAIDPEGVVTTQPASFQFRILPPLWQRWWFLVLATMFVSFVIYLVYRQRLARLIELERVRTRIATDLHDDIGANLSLIAMLSEVAHTQLPNGDQRLKEWFSTIATTSRDTVDAMSDIVWAINPRRDQLSDLTRRMRRFAGDVCGPRNIQLNFDAPEPERHVKLGADLRREIFLIFKETINNMMRHSQCTEATVEIQIARGWLVMCTSDNGKGLMLSVVNEGTGLASMKQRAEKLGGSLDISSANSGGTCVTLKVPLDGRRKLKLSRSDVH
jgi:ligand-binding sensor domain-containing protein/signal transduction histidine kinase